MQKCYKDDVTILVNSCDDYSDAWDPFFRLLKIQWSECEDYNIVLSTHSKNYYCDFLDVKTITSGDKPWSTRIWNALKRINTEYVLFFLEDQFLQKPVNVDWLNKAFEYMKRHTDTGVIILRHTGKQKDDYPEVFFPRERVSEKFRIVGMAAIYRKDYLFKILRKHENVWEFEYYASIRSKRYKEKVLQYNKRNPEIFVYNDEEESGLGIKYGKWLPKNHELFEKYGICVNYDNLGVYYGKDNNESKEKTPALQNEKSICFLSCKKEATKDKKKSAEKIRIYRSLK